MLECFKRLAQQAGVQVAKPSAVVDTTSGKIKYTDLEFRPSEVFQGAAVVLDFSITYPSVSTTRRSISQGAAAHMREAEKDKKYQVAVDKDNKIFVPIVLETHGYWSDKVDTFLSTLLKAAVARSRASFSSLRHYWTCELSTALQRGNGDRYWREIGHSYVSVSSTNTFYGSLSAAPQSGSCCLIIFMLIEEKF